MESSITIYTTPTFNTHPSTDIADIADRVVHELLTENGFGYDDVFSFSDDDIPAVINTTEMVTRNTEDAPLNVDEHDFEFPVVCSDSNSSPISTDQISLHFPLFDRSLLSEVDLNSSNSVNSPEIGESKPSPRTRPSLRELLSGDRDPPSTSATEDLDGITPGTYCVWTPKAEPCGKHKKSNSVSIGNISKRWKVPDLLKRSYSDDNYSTGKDSPVVLFLSPISPKQKAKDEKVNKIEKTTKTGKVAPAGSGGVAATAKTERKIPAYKAKIGNIRLPPYLPYRQDQVAAFANFNGTNSNLYRY